MSAKSQDDILREIESWHELEADTTSQGLEASRLVSNIKKQVQRNKKATREDRDQRRTLTVEDEYQRRRCVALDIPPVTVGQGPTTVPLVTTTTATTTQLSVSTPARHRLPDGTHTEVMGLTEGFTQVALASRYRELSLLVHPDRNGGSADEFNRLNEAYLALGGNIIKDNVARATTTTVEQRSTALVPAHTYQSTLRTWKEPAANGILQLPIVLFAKFNTPLGEYRVSVDLMYIDEGEATNCPQSTHRPEDLNFEFFHFRNVDSDYQSSPIQRIHTFLHVRHVEPAHSPLQQIVGRWFSSPQAIVRQLGLSTPGWDAFTVAGHRMTLRSLLLMKETKRTRWCNSTFFSQTLKASGARPEMSTRDVLALLCRDELRERARVEADMNNRDLGFHDVRKAAAVRAYDTPLGRCIQVDAVQDDIDTVHLHYFADYLPSLASFMDRHRPNLAPHHYSYYCYTNHLLVQSAEDVHQLLVHFRTRSPEKDVLDVSRFSQAPPAERHFLVHFIVRDGSCELLPQTSNEDVVPTMSPLWDRLQDSEADTSETTARMCVPVPRSLLHLCFGLADASDLSSLCDKMEQCCAQQEIKQYGEDLLYGGRETEEGRYKNRLHRLVCDAMYTLVGRLHGYDPNSQARREFLGREGQSLRDMLKDKLKKTLNDDRESEQTESRRVVEEVYAELQMARETQEQQVQKERDQAVVDAQPYYQKLKKDLEIKSLRAAVEEAVKAASEAKLSIGNELLEYARRLVDPLNYVELDFRRSWDKQSMSWSMVSLPLRDRSSPWLKLTPWCRDTLMKEEARESPAITPEMKRAVARNKFFETLDRDLDKVSVREAVEKAFTESSKAGHKTSRPCFLEFARQRVDPENYIAPGQRNSLQQFAMSWDNVKRPLSDNDNWRIRGWCAETRGKEARGISPAISPEMRTQMNDKADKKRKALKAAACNDWDGDIIMIAQQQEPGYVHYPTFDNKPPARDPYRHVLDARYELREAIVQALQHEALAIANDEKASVAKLEEEIVMLRAELATSRARPAAAATPVPASTASIVELSDNKDNGQKRNTTEESLSHKRAADELVTSVPVIERRSKKVRHH